MSAPAISGLILAGGAARRMGGADKALQALHGRPLLATIMNRFAPQVSEVLISANDAQKYAAFGATVVADLVSGAGPLAGIQAGLKAAAHPLLATVPCDAPYLPHDLVMRLAAAMEKEQADIALARTPDGRQPMFSLLRRATLPALSAYLQSGGRKADGWHAGLRVAEVAFDDARAFSNINTSEELAAHNAARG